MRTVEPLPALVGRPFQAGLAWFSGQGRPAPQVVRISAHVRLPDGMTVETPIMNEKSLA